MEKLFFIILGISLGISSLSAKVWAADIKAQVKFEGETLSFELSGHSNWDYDLKRVSEKGQSKVQLFVKDIGADFSEAIKNIKNPFVKSIQVKKNAIDADYMVEFTLVNNRVESFDYLTDQPSKLIIDFYKSEAAVAETKIEKNEGKGPIKKIMPKLLAENNANTTITTTEENEDSSSLKKASRKPADVDYLRIGDPNDLENSFLARAGLFDAGDAQFKRFNMKESDYKEESVIKSRSNYYLRFPALETEFLFWKNMKANSPYYEIKSASGEENKQARLLQKLFSKNRFMVFLQTADWFAKKYPSSEYMESVHYMRGDAFTELWRSEKADTFYKEAQNSYREALEKYPQSVLGERASLLTGMLAIEKADYLSAIRKLHSHVENKKYEGKISARYGQLGLSYAYSKLNKLDEALKQLDLLEKNTKEELILTEAAVRRGDFYFTTGKLKEAVQSYDKAIKMFPKISKLFPSAYFNKMESQFWLEEFKNSHQTALEFAQYFPANEFAPYALTRVGELLDIMGADQTKSVGAFLETHFRYGDSPKTIVARLHLLSTKMKSMKDEELKITLEKMNELASKSDLPNVDQFKVAMEADGFSRRKNYSKAVEILSKFFQQNPNRKDSRQVTQRIVKNINDEMKNLADEKEYLKLLKTYQNYSDTWLKGQNRIDTDYLLGQSYSHAGAYSVAIDKFNNVWTGMNAIKGKPYEKEVYINQYLPTFDGLSLKLAKNHYDNGNFQEAYKTLERIEKPLQMSEAEQIERVQIASMLYEQKGDHATAVRYLSELSNLWQGDSKLVYPINFKLAETLAQKNDPEAASVAFEKCKETILTEKDMPISEVQKLAQSYAGFLIKNKQADKAITMLSEVIAKYEGQALSQERYLLGNLHFKNGEIKKADQVWKNFKDESIWKKLSTEKLQQASWDVEYKKHIKRIPAMTKIEE